jgi:hypothetical protein
MNKVFPLSIVVVVVVVVVITAANTHDDMEGCYKHAG